MVIDGPICSGIVGMVRYLNRLGFKTTDSGDGSHFQTGMEGASEVPMVSIRLHNKDDLVREADSLARRLVLDGATDFEVEASYSTHDEIALIIVHGRGLLNWRGKGD